jgi:hypothetical protein
MFEAEPRVALKVIARPLKKLLPRFNEPTRDLKSDVCSVTLEAEPKESLRVLANPLLA